MFLSQTLTTVALGLTSLAGSRAQNILADPGVSGPPVEIVHLYYDEWPTGTPGADKKLDHVLIT